MAPSTLSLSSAGCKEGTFDPGWSPDGRIEKGSPIQEQDGPVEEWKLMIEKVVRNKIR